MKRFEEMTVAEKVTFINASNLFDWEVGGWYNCILDGCKELIPNSLEEAKARVCEDTLNCHSNGGGHYSIRPIEEPRIAGCKFIRECVDELFRKDEDGDVAIIAEEMGWRGEW